MSRRARWHERRIGSSSGSALRPRRQAHNCAKGLGSVQATDPGDHAQPNGSSDLGAASEADVSSVVNGPSRVAVCHINHAARCEYLFAMLRRSDDGNQRGSLLRSTRPGTLIGGTTLPSFLSATRTTAWCLVLEESAADRLVSKRPGRPRPARR